jgi:hypothetical protein
MVTGPWRTPAGAAQAAGPPTAQALVAAIVEVVIEGVALAIGRRVAAGEISDRGDAASTYFYDPARIEQLVAGAAPPVPPEAIEHARRERSLLGGIAGSDLPLCGAFARWALDDDDRRILLVLLAAALSPRASRLLAVLSGDPSTPAITVDACAAILEPGEAGVARAAARLGGGAPLVRLGLAQLARPEAPLARRPIAMAGRLVELALGTRELDPGCGAVRVAPSLLVPRELDAVRRTVRALCDQRERRVVGAIAAQHDGPGELAALLAELGRPLLAVPAAGLVDRHALAAIAREALLLDAVLAVELDDAGALAVGARIDELAAAVPTVMVYTHASRTPRVTAPIAAIALPPVTTADLQACLRDRLGVAVPGVIPDHPLALGRALQRLDLDPDLDPDRMVEAVAAQVMPVPPGDVLVHGADVRADATPIIDAVVQAWTAAPPPRRLRVLLTGPRGAGKAEICAAIGRRLGIAAAMVEPFRAAPADLGAAVEAGAAIAVIRNPNEEELKVLATNMWWNRIRGLWVVVTSVLRPELASSFDLHLKVSPR